MEQIEVAVGEYTFRCRAAGPDDGELVLLLHGFPQTSLSWRGQVMALADAGYRVVAPDQRGYSPGARPHEVDAYRSPHLVADVLGIADDIGGHAFHLVGHDWGGAVAWQVAGRYPQRLRTLTVLSTPHPAAFSRGLAGEGGSDQAERSSYFDVFRRDDAEVLMLEDGARRLRQMFEATGLSGPDVDEYVRTMEEPGAMRGALNWYRAADLTLVEGMGPITMPTLYVWGTIDPALGPDAAHWTGECVDGPYRFEPLEGIGHWIAETATERLNSLLLEHLRSHG